MWSTGNPPENVTERVVVELKAKKEGVFRNPVQQLHNRDKVVYYMEQLHPVPTMGVRINFTVDLLTVYVHFLG